MSNPAEQMAGPRTKLDIIRAHLVTAVQLVAVEASPVSTHLIVMATEELIRSVAARTRQPLTVDVDNRIRPERRAEFRRAQRAAYNFFKHADRDHSAPYTGPSLADLNWINEVQTTLNILSFHDLGGNVTDLNAFNLLLVGRHPWLFQDDFVELVRNEVSRFVSLEAGDFHSELRSILRYLKLLPA